MAVYRTIPTTFWEDTKVSDDFTPEDKYFMLYCLTNSHTNLCGCYEISLKQMSIDLGYNVECIKNLLKRFTEVHKVLNYDFDNKELFIKNWPKYNWTKSEKLNKPLLNEIKEIKTKEFKSILSKKYNERDTVSIPYTYPMDTTCIDTTCIDTTVLNCTVTVSDTDNENEDKNKNEMLPKISKEEFNKIWNMFPINKRENDSITLMYITSSIKNGETFKDILLGTERYMKDLEDTKYCKKTTNFFKDEAWKEYAKEEQKQDSLKNIYTDAEKEAIIKTLEAQGIETDTFKNKFC